jgi:hypothetical protein
MTRAQWRQLAHRLRASFNARKPPSPREQLDLWAATEDRIAAQGRVRWL